MPTNELKCLRCDGLMETGFVVDRGDSSIAGIQSWAEGVPEKSFFTGLKLKGRRQLFVETHRCVKCGYLESYAPARAST